MSWQLGGLCKSAPGLPVGCPILPPVECFLPISASRPLLQGPPPLPCSVGYSLPPLLPSLLSSKQIPWFTQMFVQNFVRGSENAESDVTHRLLLRVSCSPSSGKRILWEMVPDVMMELSPEN